MTRISTSPSTVVRARFAMSRLQHLGGRIVITMTVAVAIWTPRDLVLMNAPDPVIIGPAALPLPRPSSSLTGSTMIAPPPTMMMTPLTMIIVDDLRALPVTGAAPAPGLDLAPIPLLI